MTHADTVPRWLQTDGIGVEIGAFKSPVPGIKPFYVDRFAEYAGEKCLAEFWGDACHLPFHDDSLDYVVTSHVLEHVANPVAALVEWHRVLRSGGIMYLVVPDRRFTFDHPREPTEPEHMWADFTRSTTQSDATHIDEFLDRVDWTRYHPTLTPEGIIAHREDMRRAYHIAVGGKTEINIHFHVFEPGNLRALVELAAQRLGHRWTIVDVQESFPADCPNGILLVVRVDKGLRRWWRGWRNAQRARRDRRSVVRADAQPLSADGEMRRTH